MTDIGGPLFLLACLALMFGMLVIAAVIEGIARGVHPAAPTGPAPSPDCGCRGCRGTADAPRPRG